MKSLFYSILILSGSLLLCSCGKSVPTLKVAATSIPHGEILEFIQPEMEQHHIHLEVIVIDDFNTPNRALADGEIDANFFQHLPFLEAQKNDFGYALTPLTAVHMEPMAVYSKKTTSLKALKDGAMIAIPSDPSNQARALALLEKAELITLEQKGEKTSLLDIKGNAHKFRFIEMDSALLSRALDDVDAAVITANYALLVGLSPKTDALAIENGQSRFANFVVIRDGEEQREDLQTLKSVITSDKVRKFIEDKYQGAVIPASK